MSERHLERTIGLPGATFLIIGYVVGASIFILPGSLGGQIGPAIWVAYLLAALIMKPGPVIPLDSEDEQEFYDSYTGNRHRALKRLKHRFERLERRIQRMEHVVTGPEYDWDRRMKERR